MSPMHKFSVKSSSLRVCARHLSAHVESVRHYLSVLYKLDIKLVEKVPVYSRDVGLEAWNWT